MFTYVLKIPTEILFASSVALIKLMICIDWGQKMPFSSVCKNQVLCCEATACACCCFMFGPEGTVCACDLEGTVSSSDRQLLHSASKDVSFFELLCWHLRTDIHCNFFF